MKLPTHTTSSALRGAFSLVEVMVGVLVLGIVLISLYAGFGSGFLVMQVTRENLRATQILMQRMETIRLYTWAQLHDTNYFPLTFIESYGPTAGTNSTVYTGKVINAAGNVAVPGPPDAVSSGLPDAYRTNIALVRIQITWPSSGTLRTREMQTYVARSGIQRYIYN
ncbi:MAG: prepilin-type N-terminal cleavage/methylation domain-containing protein [Verrucomicrobia bacterium]|nr:prepilin-type N-terminal cleavage/methylation domain-containing protein [Verrucomicrobiota bacterium]